MPPDRLAVACQTGPREPPAMRTRPVALRIATREERRLEPHAGMVVTTRKEARVPSFAPAVAVRPCPESSARCASMLASRMVRPATALSIAVR